MALQRLLSNYSPLGCNMELEYLLVFSAWSVEGGTNTQGSSGLPWRRVYIETSHAHSIDGTENSCIAARLRGLLMPAPNGATCRQVGLTTRPLVCHQGREPSYLLYGSFSSVNSLTGRLRGVRIIKRNNVSAYFL
ncbi:hypothetical protein AVEN_74218-1 [Araneus ventricosus]|uniref:Uncharacterized protein n=1 Tax=Araneus ventricosus TaxID=182803 RepID=A0A4Y2ERN9_ARAVE|nr:hypothetical protein AVEN_74218-1 [Araneus ventricosus]